MAASRYNRIAVRLFADDAGKGDIFQDRRVVVVVSVEFSRPVGAGYHRALGYFILLDSLVPVLIQLPSTGPVASIMNKNTGVAETIACQYRFQLV